MKKVIVDEGFNNIKPWLSAKLKERGLSVDRFSLATDSRVQQTAVRRWYADVCRPYPEKMKIVCEVLSRLPIIGEDGSRRKETVKWSEGLEQYSPKPRAWVAHKLRRPTQ